MAIPSDRVRIWSLPDIADSPVDLANLAGGSDGCERGASDSALRPNRLTTPFGADQPEMQPGLKAATGPEPAALTTSAETVRMEQNEPSINR